MNELTDIQKLEQSRDELIKQVAITNESLKEAANIRVTDTNHASVLVAIAKLEVKVDNVIDLQKTANGRTTSNEVKIQAIKERMELQDGIIKGIKSTVVVFNIIWGAVIAFGGLLVAAVSLYVQFIHK